jgi:hypothetical protein
MSRFVTKTLFSFGFSSGSGDFRGEELEDI